MVGETFQNQEEDRKELEGFQACMVGETFQNQEEDRKEFEIAFDKISFYSLSLLAMTQSFSKAVQEPSGSLT